MSSNSPLIIGALGCANIARQFIRDVRASKNLELMAVASRDLEKSTQFAKENRVPNAYGSYEALLADPKIDAIYLPLPNSMHAEWAIKAAQAGKHILCEKPLALGLDEAKRMFAAARDNKVVLLEAYPYFFQPQTQAMLDILKSGEIGDVRSVQSLFGFTVPNPDTNIRLRPELGGGALLDAGSYSLSIIRAVMGCAPIKVRADATWVDSGVDISMMATLFYADGLRAQLSCAMDVANCRRATISATKGTIDTEYINHTSKLVEGDEYGYLTSQLRVRYGTANNIPFKDIVSEPGSGFLYAAKAFADMVRTQYFSAFEEHAVVSIENAATLEAIEASAKTGELASVKR
jgi:predicted dehydrogenase